MALLRHPHRQPHRRALAQQHQEHTQQRERQQSSPLLLSPCLARRRRSRRQTRSLRASERSQRERGAQRSVRGAKRRACPSRSVRGALLHSCPFFAAALRRRGCIVTRSSARLVSDARHRNARRAAGRRAPEAAVPVTGGAHPTCATLLPQRRRNSAPAVRRGAPRASYSTHGRGTLRSCGAAARGGAREVGVQVPKTYSEYAYSEYDSIRPSRWELSGTPS